MLAGWLTRLTAYDGVLPLAIWLTPRFVALAFPNQRGLIEIIAIVLPVFGCLVRFYVGRRIIACNLCSKRVRWIQVVALSLGVVLLALVDCVIVLMYIMPRDAFVQNDWGILLVLWCFYFVLMAAAIYPGRSA